MEVRTSLSLSADTSDHLNSAWPPRVPPRTGSNIERVVCDCYAKWIVVTVCVTVLSCTYRMAGGKGTGILSGVFTFVSREFDSFLANATGSSVRNPFSSAPIS